MVHNLTIEMSSSEWLTNFGGKLDTDYERQFVLKVLTEILDFNFSALTAQFPFIDSDGKNRRCDFVIQEGDHVKIAVEIDGYDKTGTGSGMSRTEFLDWNRRQSALVTQGWRLIRFPNVDVRDHPERCAEYVALLLREGRSKSAHSEQLRHKIDQLEKSTLAVKEKYKNDHLEKSTLAANSLEVEALEKELAVAYSNLDQAQKSEALDTHSKARLEELNEAQNHIEILEEDASTMKTTIWAFTFLLSVIILALVLTPIFDKESTDPQPNISSTGQPQVMQPARTKLPESQAQQVARGEDCRRPIGWREATDFIGQTVAVSGTVLDVITRPDVNGQPTWITVGASFPNPRLTLVIWGANRNEFNSDLAGMLEGKVVCAYGEIETYKGNAQIELLKPAQLNY